jgi:YD repeat-containing protein
MRDIKAMPGGKWAPVVAVAGPADSAGIPFDPNACAHTYGYDASGLIVTDTATDGATTWVKTYTYNAAAQLTGETKWVRA